VKVTDRRTNQDFAECMRELIDVHYPLASIILARLAWDGAAAPFRARSGLSSDRPSVV